MQGHLPFGLYQQRSPPGVHHWSGLTNTGSRSPISGTSLTQQTRIGPADPQRGMLVHPLRPNSLFKLSRNGLGLYPPDRTRARAVPIGRGRKLRAGGLDIPITKAGTASGKNNSGRTLTGPQNILRGRAVCQGRDPGRPCKAHRATFVSCLYQ